MNFENYLKENAKKVDQVLRSELTEFYKETKKTNIKLLPFAKKLIHSCYGGKRIRGILCKLGYEIAQSVIPAKAGIYINNGSRIKYGMTDKEILKVAVAFEILHTSLLIHDDIIDQSPKRRGEASLYMALGGKHYGISQAINLGDIGLYLPIKIISKTSFPAEYKIKALSYFSQMLINTGWGQIMDVEKNLRHTSSKDNEFINLYKTAKYTIAGPLQLGAILAGANEELTKKLGQFGENAGIAFQIQDDILDGESGKVDLAHAQAVKYASYAKKMIPAITKDESLAKLLQDLTKYLVERIK